MRFSSHGWNLLSLIPVIKKRQGNYKAMGFKRRQLMLLHDAIKIFLKPILDNPIAFVECSDGWVRECHFFVSVWLGDREEHEFLCGMMKV
jgi:hypothetical protein